MEHPFEHLPEQPIEQQPETPPAAPLEPPVPPHPPVPSQPFAYMPGTTAPQYTQRPTPPPQPYYGQQPPVGQPYYSQPAPPQQPYYQPPMPPQQPYYGQPPYGYPYYGQPTPPPHKLNWLSVTALTLSIIGLAGFVVLLPLWFVWAPCSLAGLVMAIVAKAKKVPGGKTTAALVCGIVGTVLWLIVAAVAFMVLNAMTELPYEFYESMPYYEDYMHDI